MGEPERLNVRLYESLTADPETKAQTDRILNEFCCDVSPDCLCTAHMYYHLSKIIPKNRTVFDLGCAYAFQAWYFRHHKKYIGVDILCKIKDRISFPNTRHYMCSIESFIQNHCREKREDPNFAICCYVPPWHQDNEALVRKHFDHVFVFYPSLRDHDDVDHPLGWDVLDMPPRKPVRKRKPFARFLREASDTVSKWRPDLQMQLGPPPKKVRR